MQLHFNGHSYRVNVSETVLDCLLRHGLSIPSSCRAGICQSCMLRAIDGDPGTAAQNGLKPSRKEQNFFLACRCLPQQNLNIALPSSDSLSVKTSVIGVERLSSNVIRVRLQVPTQYEYHAGQYLRVFHPNGESRNYSIASLPGIDNFLELHLRIIRGGLLSNWFATELKAGDEISIGEAIGDCYYTADDQRKPILLIGTGTGLAPLYGILRDAMENKHLGPIYLYHGSRDADGLYLHDTLTKLNQLSGFTYIPSISSPSQLEHPTDNIRHGRCNELALADYPQLSAWRAYICGNADMVKSTQKAVFLAGAAMSDIFVDSFLPTNPGHESTRDDLSTKKAG